MVYMPGSHSMTTKATENSKGQIILMITDH